MLGNDTDNRTNDHAQQHESGHVITRLHEQPHRHDRGKEQICHNNIDPGTLCRIHWKFHTNDKHDNQQGNGNHCANPLFHFPDLFLNQAKDDGNNDKQHGNGCRCGIRIACCLCHPFHTFSDKRSGNHIGKSCHNQKGKQPAEQHK